MKSLLVSISLLGFSAGALAQEQTLTVYLKKGYLEYFDEGPKEPSIGDMYVRQGEVSLSADGEAVGEYFTKATIVYLNKEINKSVRSYTAEIILPEGSIYKTDFLRMRDGKPISKDHKHTGAIVGGTGKYAGIRGSYTLGVSPSGNDAKTTLTYWLGQ